VRIVAFAAAVAFVSLGASGAQAAGCLSGAAVGGVAGHMAGHHGLLGAAAGCAVGHHMANQQRQRDQQARINANPSQVDTQRSGRDN